MPVSVRRSTLAMFSRLKVTPLITVSMPPGWIEFTRMPWRPSSIAAVLVMPRTAHFEAL